ncbi:MULTISPECIES: hypothetical protein [Pseudomonas]|uniref:hypothetical protein n=1 Tax=Pseudomonas TaxID=286 RepID=UPI0012E7E096|nr:MULTISPECIES: hypothetical protein [Pseudomonas]
MSGSYWPRLCEKAWTVLKSALLGKICNVWLVSLSGFWRGLNKNDIFPLYWLGLSRADQYALSPSWQDSKSPKFALCGIMQKFIISLTVCLGNETEGCKLLVSRLGLTRWA